jgi:hypothetical protein
MLNAGFVSALIKALK